TNASTVSWTVNFSEPVQGVAPSNFTLDATGPTGMSITSITGAGSTWTVTANAGSGDGDLGLDLSDPTGITDTYLNPLSATFTGESYTIDRTPPNVLALSRADPN